MTESTRAASGRIFMSYRREETAYPAGWLYDRLAQRFGGGQVFKDVDSIELGDDFVEVITTAVGSCDVLLALIGDRWLTITDADGRRRVDDPEDFVRLEIEAALARNVRVVPILVEGARMPEAGDLPPSLARLARRQALELSPSRFDFDLSRLLRVLDKTLAEAQARAAAREPEAAGLALWTERDTRTRQRGPARDLIDQLVAELSLPGQGNSFLVIEREDRRESYAQTARTADNDYVIEYRDGDAARHYASPHLTMPEAQAALCGWAFNLPGWRDRLTWTRVPLGYLAAAGTGSAADLGPARSRGGTWAPPNGTAQDGTAPMSTPAVNAPDPGTRQAPVPERREQARRSGTPSIRPADPAMPDGAQPPGNLGKPPGKQRGRFSRRARILAGAAAIALILLIVVVAANSGSPPPLPTSLMPATATIFHDNFSSPKYGWTHTAIQGASARYDNGAYRILHPRTPDTGFVSEPRKAKRVYPSAPPDIGIKVDARAVPGSDQEADAGYGIFCREGQNGDNGYAFAIWGTSVAIEKFRDGGFSELQSTNNYAVHVIGNNLLQAQCTNKGQGVYLVFSVNDQIVAAWTDTDNPLRTGSVALGVLTGPHVTKGITAEFSNFVVTQVQGIRG